MSKFQAEIDEFNRVFGLPAPPRPTRPLVQRLGEFNRMFYAEFKEGDSVWYKTYNGESDLSVLTEYADWLGDMIVYCASEMRRHGLPMQEILSIIVESQFTKLGLDGNPIFKDGKIQKGPNYVKPEPKIEALLKEKMNG